MVMVETRMHMRCLVNLIKITHMMSNMEQLNLNVPSAPKPEWGALRQKQRAQVKSKFYYIFWGVATASVVLGQLLSLIHISEPTRPY